MNQAVKNVVYMKGTRRQVRFLASIGGMNEEETETFMLLHDGKTDEYIQSVLGMSRKSYDRVLEAVRAKLNIAVFECINAHMEDFENE